MSRSKMLLPLTFLSKFSNFTNPLKTLTLNPQIQTSHHFSTSFLITKTPKKFRKKRKKPQSPRTKPVSPNPSTRLPHLESLVERDSYFRFLTKTKHFLSQQPQNLLRFQDSQKLYQQLGFPRGRKIHRFLLRHPLLFRTFRHSDNKMWLGFSGFMSELLAEERRIMDSMEKDRVCKVRKLLMMSRDRRIELKKIENCRFLFGIPDDFRDRVLNYPGYFRVLVEGDGRRVLELVSWEEGLAVSALEREFVVDEDKAKKAFRFPVKHGRGLGLKVEDRRRLDLLNALPLVSPYSGDGGRLDVWSLEAEKFRVGVLHEFLSLTLEKKALIHQILEFREEFCLTRQTFDMLKKQPQTFYLAGTEMNWVVFLRDAYDERGELIDKDPQVLFNEKLYMYAQMKEGELSSTVWR